MVNCAILSCKNNSGRNQNDVSFHTFPQDPIVAEKWIAATGDPNWFPTKNSVICSIHFDKSYYTEAKKCPRLIKTAYPTIGILKWIKEQSTPDKGLINNNNRSRKRNLEEEINSPSSSDEEPTNMQKKAKVILKLNKAQETIRQQAKLIKLLREQNLRKIKKIHSLLVSPQIFKQKKLVGDKQAQSLKHLNAMDHVLPSTDEGNR